MLTCMVLILPCPVSFFLLPLSQWGTPQSPGPALPVPAHYTALGWRCSQEALSGEERPLPVPCKGRLTGPTRGVALMNSTNLDTTLSAKFKVRSHPVALAKCTRLYQSREPLTSITLATGSKAPL
jgi:hypothetical protein